MGTPIQLDNALSTVSALGYSLSCVCLCVHLSVTKGIWTFPRKQVNHFSFQVQTAIIHVLTWLALRPSARQSPLCKTKDPAAKLRKRIFSPHRSAQNLRDVWQQGIRRKRVPDGNFKSSVTSSSHKVTPFISRKRKRLPVLLLGKYFKHQHNKQGSEIRMLQVCWWVDQKNYRTGR